MPAPAELTPSLPRAAAAVRSVPELAALLRQLRRREARSRVGATLTYRALAARTGWSHAIIGEYFAGTALPPTDRFDQLIQLLGATPDEQGALATARDRVEELRRHQRSAAAPPDPVRRRSGEFPAPVTGFVGRDEELAELDRVAATAAGGDRPAILVVCGGAGVGKTALVRQWAGQHATRFPDGKLFVDLHGFSPRRPVAALDALGRLLRALGAQADAVPAGVDEGASRLRSALAGRRVLLVLDNALDAGQVRPLLAGAAGSLVLVTSRDSLAGLVAADGAHRLRLGELPDREAVRLLGTLAPGDTRQLAALARLGGGMPSALRALAALAVARSERGQARPGAELDDEAVERAVLDAGEPPTIRQALSWSYGRVSARAARLFRLMGVDPGPDSGTAALASLAGLRMSQARPILLELSRAHLIHEVASGRYAMARVVRAYARDLLDREAPEDRLPAIRRLLDHYVDSVGDAPAWAQPQRRSVEAAARLARAYGFADHVRALTLAPPPAPPAAWQVWPWTRQPWGGGSASLVGSGTGR